jgi:hypothetical protein
MTSRLVSTCLLSLVASLGNNSIGFEKESKLCHLDIIKAVGKSTERFGKVKDSTNVEPFQYLWLDFHLVARHDVEIRAGRACGDEISLLMNSNSYHNALTEVDTRDFHF